MTDDEKTLKIKELQYKLIAYEELVEHTVADQIKSLRPAELVGFLKSVDAQVDNCPASNKWRHLFEYRFADGTTKIKTDPYSTAESMDLKVVDVTVFVDARSVQEDRYQNEAELHKTTEMHQQVQRSYERLKRTLEAEIETYKEQKDSLQQQLDAASNARDIAETALAAKDNAITELTATYEKYRLFVANLDKLFHDDIDRNDLYSTAQAIKKLFEASAEMYDAVSISQQYLRLHVISRLIFKDKVKRRLKATIDVADKAYQPFIPIEEPPSLVHD